MFVSEILHLRLHVSCSMRITHCKRHVNEDEVSLKGTDVEVIKQIP